MVYVFNYVFSYSSLLELQYGVRVRKSWIAREQAREMGTLVREAEQGINIGLFLDKYPRWELGTPHQLVILHEMFLHTAERGQKEAEHMVCQGSASKPDLEAGYSTMGLVGYQTSCKEIRNIYQSVYLLRRPPGLSSCGDQLRRTIRDILSSLANWLHRHGYPAAAREDPESEEEWQPRQNRWEPYEEALGALDTTEVLWGNIEVKSKNEGYIMNTLQNLQQKLQ